MRWLELDFLFKFKGAFGERSVGVAGGRTNVGDVNNFLKKLSEIDQEQGTTSQVFKSSCIAGVEHLLHSARLALTAFATGTNFASSLGVELACWTSAQRQIGRALDTVGITKDDKEIALVTIGYSNDQVKRAINEILFKLNITRDDSVLKINDKKIQILIAAFSIPHHLLKTYDIQKLVMERIALLALEK